VTIRNAPVIDYRAALSALATIREAVEARGKTAAIAIADSHGELVAFVRMDGVLLSSGPLAINKAYTAARLNRPSRVLGETLRARGTDVAFYGDLRYVGFGGGMPVLIDGVVAGGVGVSGLSDEEDEALAAMGVALLQGNPPASVSA
jgi:glc operon protein GlcG